MAQLTKQHRSLGFIRTPCCHKSGEEGVGGGVLRCGGGGGVEVEVKRRVGVEGCNGGRRWGAPVHSFRIENR